MRISVIIVAVAVAVGVGGARPSRGFDSSDYRDSPEFFDSPPPPITRPSYHPGSYSRGESYLRPAFSDDSSSLFSEGPPPSFREGRIFFDSPPPPRSFSSDSYFPARRPSSFYQDALRSAFGSAHEYQGPPPPAPSKENLLKQTSTTTSLGIRDERPFDTSSELTSTNPFEESRIQHHTTTTTTHSRQPLSFGGHGSHLNFGDHSLGFASVAAITSSDINPLGVGEPTATTRAAAAATSSLPMHSGSAATTSSGNSYQVSQRQPATDSSSRQELPTSAAPTPAPKIASTAQATQSSPSTARLNDPTSTTPATTRLTSVAPKSGLDPVQNQLNQMSDSSMMMVQEAPKPSYEFRTIEPQELPPAAHGQLPIEPQKQQIHIPDIKHNFLIYDSKPSLPYYQPSFQINQQANNNNNNISPLRFSIATAPIASSLMNQPGSPIKIAIQGVDFSRSPVTFATVGANMNSYLTGQNQLDIAQFNKLTSETNPAPSYYIVQSNNQAKPAAQVTSNIPLGSFFLLPNNEQVKSLPQTNSNVPSGLQLQLGGFNGIEYFVPSSNSEQTRPVNLDAAKLGLNLQDRFRLPEPSYAKIEYQQQQSRW